MLLKRNEKVMEKRFLEGELEELTTVLPGAFDYSLEVTDKKFNMFEKLAENFDYCKVHKDGFKPIVFLLSMISAKSKKMFATTDVGIALTNPYALKKLNVAIKTNGEIMTEGNVRNFIDKVVVYEDEDEEKIKIKESGHLWIEYFNRIGKTMLKSAEKTNVHILDCVKIPVNEKNRNYELSTLINYEGKKMRGYKLGVLRRVTQSGGIIEYLVDGTMSDHDLSLVEKEILESDIIKEKEYLVMDRGFISIEFISKIHKKGIYVIIPAKKNMNIYNRAIEVAKEKALWKTHPNPKRKGEEIAQVTDLKGEWIAESDKTKKPGKEKNEEIDFNACVIRIDKENQKNNKIIKSAIKEGNAEDEKYVYIVILSTDTKLNASQIVRKYEQRPEIEEDFRQIKDEWKLATFMSTKYNYIMCHIAMIMIGYNIFSLFKSTDEGKKYLNRSMRSIEKEDLTRAYRPSETFFFVSSRKSFDILTFSKMLELYGKCNEEIQSRIRKLV